MIPMVVLLTNRVLRAYLSHWNGTIQLLTFAAPNPNMHEEVKVNYRNMLVGILKEIYTTFSKRVSEREGD